MKVLVFIWISITAYGIGCFSMGIYYQKLRKGHIMKEIKKWKKEMRGKEIKIIKPSEAHRENNDG